ncbi:hypothetical protein R1flu_000696 [Riccia fluitans]|uniref:Bacterial recombinase A n=1 Tax=Riccia fluitans TaxID=41844 RepID=A0ABD1Y1I8_9MARC
MALTGGAIPLLFRPSNCGCYQASSSTGGIKSMGHKPSRICFTDLPVTNASRKIVSRRRAAMEVDLSESEQLSSDFHERSRGRDDAVENVAGGRRQMLMSVMLFTLSSEMARAEELSQDTEPLPLEIFSDVKVGFTMLRPADWNKVDKPGATVYFEDPQSSKNNIGVTVNPVRISSLKAFGTVDDVTEKLIAAERDKPSTKEMKVIRVEERNLLKDTPLYQLEYTLETSRGSKRVLTAVTVSASKLYILNIVYADGSKTPAPVVVDDALHRGIRVKERCARGDLAGGIPDSVKFQRRRILEWRDKHSNAREHGSTAEPSSFSSFWSWRATSRKSSGHSAIENDTRRHSRLVAGAGRGRRETPSVDYSDDESTSNRATNRQKALEAAMADINNSFGKGSVTRLGSAGGAIVETFPSGCLTLDFALGGGLPKGRIVEIYGPESSGKTTLALHAIAAIQKTGGNAMLVDAEHAFDPDYSRALGVDVENLIVCQPDNGEMALETADRMCRSGAVDLICIDSVSALTPRAEIEGEIGMQQIGLQARLMSQALRKMSANASRAGCTLIFINQIRYKVGVMFGNPEITSGGLALKFFASLRLEIRSAGKIKSPKGEDDVGIRARVRVQKSKVSRPYKQAEFDIIFGEGICTQGCILDCAETMGVIQKKGSWYSFGDTRLGQGREKVVQFLRENPQMCDNIERLMTSKFWWTFERLCRWCALCLTVHRHSGALVQCADSQEKQSRRRL